MNEIDRLVDALAHLEDARTSLENAQDALNDVGEVSDGEVEWRSREAAGDLHHIMTDDKFDPWTQAEIVADLLRDDLPSYVVVDKSEYRTLDSFEVGGSDE